MERKEHEDILRSCLKCVDEVAERRERGNWSNVFHGFGEQECKRGPSFEFNARHLPRCFVILLYAYDNYKQIIMG